MIPLPINCEASYRPNFLNPGEAAALFSELVGGYEVTNKVIRMVDGSNHLAETGIYMFADAELVSFDALPEVWGGRAPWPESLAEVRDRIKDETGIRFQVARCVYYCNGSEGMGFHIDEPAYGPTRSIASVSLGAEREFVFRSLSDRDDELSITLGDGSLLYMGKNCQNRYQHGLPRRDDCTAPRINLTFRMYGWE
jgi:hypothetical protein